MSDSIPVNNIWNRLKSAQAGGRVGNTYALLDDAGRFAPGSVAGVGIGYFVDVLNGDDENDGKTIANAFQTLGAAIAAAVAFDTIFVLPGFYEEGNLSIAAAKSNLTIIGLGNRGACGLEPANTGDEGIEVLADDVTFINFGVAKGDTADYALRIGSQTVSPNRFRAYGCKFEGAGIVLVLKGCGDVILYDSEFAWCASAILFDDNDNGYATQIHIDRCFFHNFTTVALGIASGGLVKNLRLQNCIFDAQEDGTAPTDFILLSDDLNTGIIAQNIFHSNDITVGTGIALVENYSA